MTSLIATRKVYVSAPGGGTGLKCGPRFLNALLHYRAVPLANVSCVLMFPHRL